MCACERSSLDNSILHIDVCIEGLVIVHDPTAFNQEPLALRKHQRKHI